MTTVIDSESPAQVTECPSCGSGSSWSPLLKGLPDYLTHELFDICSCPGCGLQVTHPLPPTETIGRYYPPRYRGNRHAYTGLFRSHQRRRAVETCFKPGFRGRLLDLGCGDGSFAMHMQGHGWDVSATEIDEQTVDRLCHAGIDAKLSTMAQNEGFEKPFDVVTCWHVLEHVEHPRQVASWVRSQLASDGVFQPTIPNVDSLQARVFGRNWVHLDVPRHRQHFTPATLRPLLEAAGFTVQRRTNFALEYDWFGVIQSALNGICGQQNVLFDTLTHAIPDPAKPSTVFDKIVSFGLAGPIALVSLPAILASALAGDGATLTLTCR